MKYDSIEMLLKQAEKYYNRIVEAQLDYSTNDKEIEKLYKIYNEIMEWLKAYDIGGVYINGEFKLIY